MKNGDSPEKKREFQKTWRSIEMRGRGGFFKGIVSALLLNILLVILVNKALSQTAQPKLRIRARSAVLMDAISDQVLFEQNPQIRMAPASFVKILTLYIAFDALRDGQLKKDDLVSVSQKAWRMGNLTKRQRGLNLCNHRSAKTNYRSG